MSTDVDIYKDTSISISATVGHRGCRLHARLAGPVGPEDREPARYGDLVDSARISAAIAVLEEIRATPVRREEPDQP